MASKQLPSEIQVPETTIIALKDKQWRRAMEKEFEALIKNETWTLVCYKRGVKLVGNKWVYKVKQKLVGSVERYKARLVAKGYHQVEERDF